MDRRSLGLDAPNAPEAMTPDKEIMMTDAESTSPVVEVYWRPGCPYCRMLLRPLRRSGLQLREINIWEDSAAAARVRSVADENETVPTVFIGERAMVNPSLRQVLDTAHGEAQPMPWWSRWIR